VIIVPPGWWPLSVYHNNNFFRGYHGGKNLNIPMFYLSMSQNLNHVKEEVQETKTQKIEVYRVAGKAIRAVIGSEKVKIYVIKSSYVWMGASIALFKVWTNNGVDMDYSLIGLENYEYSVSVDLKLADRLISLLTAALSSGSVELIDEEVYEAFENGIYMVYFSKANHVYAIRCRAIYDLGKRERALDKARYWFSDNKNAIEAIEAFLASLPN